LIGDEGFWPTKSPVISRAFFVGIFYARIFRVGLCFNFPGVIFVRFLRSQKCKIEVLM
jgi:hypothetical protein